MEEVFNIGWKEKVNRSLYERGVNRSSMISWDAKKKLEKFVTPDGWELLSVVLHDPVEGSVAWLQHIENRDLFLCIQQWNYGDRTSFTAHSKTQKDIDFIHKLAKKWFPVAKYLPTPKENKVFVHFWTLGPNGPERFTREQSVMPWEQVKHNYNDAVQKEFERFLVKAKAGNFDAESGKLMLWTGPAGTGKTWAIRALASETTGTIDVNVIIDPDVFLQGSSAYMHRVLLKEPYEKNHWRIIILEDSGEFITKEAKKTGQGFSRLLNACDGMLGQGLKFILLVTSNEQVGEFHEATVRAGRCISNIEFKQLSREDVENWCKINEISVPSQYPLTLAQLYAIKHSENPGISKPKNIGFAPLFDNKARKALGDFEMPTPTTIFENEDE